MLIQNRNRHFILLILLAVLLSAVIVNPARNILYDDDFAYAWSVRELVENHRLKISDWTSAALVFQVFWGAAFCLPFGFSFAAINISTIALCALGLVAFFYLLGELGFPREKRAVSVLILFSSPLYFDFSFSFMSDIPYTSMMLISLYFFVRGMRSADRRWLIGGSICISLAFLTRQIAICIIAGLALSFIVEAYQSKKIDGGKMIAAFAPAVFIITAYFLWLKLIHGPTWCQRHIAWSKALEQLSNPLEYLQLLLERFLLLSVFTMIFLLPFILPFWRESRKISERWKSNKLLTGVVFCLMGGYAVFIISSGKELYVEGMFRKSILFHNIPPWLWQGIFFGAALCVGIPVIHGLIRFKEYLLARFRKQPFRTMQPVYRFLLYAFAFHFYLSIGHSFFWDDYIIPLLPFMLIFLNRLFEKMEMHLPLAAILAVIVLILSLFNTRFRYDYSNMVWREGNALIASGIEAEKISGPLDFVGWYNFEPLFARAVLENGEDNVNIFSWVRYMNQLFFFRSKVESGEGFIIYKKIPYSTFGLERTLYVMKKPD